MTPEDFFVKYETHGIALNEKAEKNILITQSPHTINGWKSLWLIRQARENHHSQALSFQTWKKVNPEIPAYYSDSCNLWITPYLGKSHPSILRLHAIVLDIYQKTGIIIADGFMRKKFLNRGGYTHCIEMDYAIDPTSEMSDLIFNQVICTPGFDDFYAIEDTETCLKTKNLIKTLFYLEQELRHVPFNRAMLTPKIIQILHQFREGNYHIYLMTLDILFHFEQIEFNPCLFTPEIVLHFMLYWNKAMTKLEVEQTLYEIHQSMIQVPHEPKASPIPGFFQHLNKRMPYTGKLNSLSF